MRCGKFIYCLGLGCPPEANPTQGFKGKEIICKMSSGNTVVEWANEKEEGRMPIKCVTKPAVVWATAVTTCELCRLCLRVAQLRDEEICSWLRAALGRLTLWHFLLALQLGHG